MKLLIALSVVAAISANAAIDRNEIQRSETKRFSALSEKKHKYIDNGVIFGGEGGRGFSLVDVRRHFSSKDQIERIVLEVGDDKGGIAKQLGYFQVSVNKELRRVDIDLSQMSGAKIDQKKLEAMFAKSPIVQTAKINYDPEDQGIIIQLQLVAKSNVEVFKVTPKDKSSRIVVDLKKIK